MNSRIALAGFLAFCCIFWGCGPSNRSPDQMNTWEFQAWIGKELEMTRVSLQGQGEGKFTGSGMKDRKLYQIKVTRDARKARWEIEHIEPGTVEKRTGSVSW